MSRSLALATLTALSLLTATAAHAQAAAKPSTPMSAAAAPAKPAPPPVAAKPATTAKLDLNTATQAQLESLPGIGPALAARIIQHRTANGPFAAVEELLNVSGIGDKKLSELEGLVTVR